MLWAKQVDHTLPPQFLAEHSGRGGFGLHERRWIRTYRHGLIKSSTKNLRSQVPATPEADLAPQLALSTRLVQDLSTAEHPPLDRNPQTR